MAINEETITGADYEDAEACGEGMCHCHCDGRHVCGCDCPRCPYCRQIPENCDCEDDEW